MKGHYYSSHPVLDYLGHKREEGHLRASIVVDMGEVGSGYPRQ